MSELQVLMNKLMADEAEKEKNRRVKGVLIRCEGDICIKKKQSGRWERYTEVAISKGRSIWKSELTPTSKIMGLPLLVHKQPHNPAWNPNDHNRFDNQTATFLNLTTDPKVEEMWGFAPPDWQN